MITEDLIQQLKDSYHEDEDRWEKVSIIPDYDYCACTNIINIIPADAKTLDEIESFEVTENISGIEMIKLKRKQS